MYSTQPGSSRGKALGHGLDGQGSILGIRDFFHSMSRIVLVSTQSTVKLIPGLSQG